MKYKIMKSQFTALMFFVTNLYLVGMVFMLIILEEYFAILILIPIAAIMLSMYKYAYIEFREDELFVRLSVFFKHIKYDNIESVKPTKSFRKASFSLSSERVEITLKGESKFFKTIDLSPENREEFIGELNRKIGTKDIFDYE